MFGTAAAASSVFTVTRTSSDPARASASDLIHGGRHIGGVGVGHGLHDDRMAVPISIPPTSTTTAVRRGKTAISPPEPSLYQPGRIAPGEICSLKKFHNQAEFTVKHPSKFYYFQ